MKLNTLLLILLTIATAAANAQDRTVSETLPSAQFDALDPLALSPSKIEFSQRLQEFQDWIATNSAESKVMNLYDGFQEPVVNYTNAAGKPETLTDFLTMYIARTKTVLNVGAAQVNLAKMIDLATINTIDSELQSRQIGVDELMNNVIAAKKTVTNFDWCNNGSDNIVKPKKETQLGYIDGKKWCSSSDRSICIESCYMFPIPWQIVLRGDGGRNTIKEGVKNVINGDFKLPEGKREDLGMGMQSEIRYYVSDAEFGASLSEVTHINTPVRGVIEQSTFYFNQVFKFGKILAVIQEHPTDASKSIMTSIVAMGVRSHSLLKPTLKDHLRGRGALTSSTGMSAGIPWYTQNMTKRIADILEGKQVAAGTN